LNQFLDQAQAVREGEELDIKKLQTFLRQELDLVEPIQVKQFPSGYSNLTYLIKCEEQDFILRRPPFGANIKMAHDMSREFRILESLMEAYDKVPFPLLYCEEEDVVGAPFYLMERVEGVILRQEVPEGLTLDSMFMKFLSENFIDNLVAIHQIDLVETELEDLGFPEGYVERQIKGWTKRYQSAKTDDVVEVEAVAAWLAENLPKESSVSLIHNDYKYDNLVLDPESLNLKAVLDWEMATVGNPLMDLGTTLGYWVDADDPDELQQMRFCLTNLPGNLNRTQLVERYGEITNQSIENALFYYVYGLFKIIGIIQQIYKRHQAGHSHDERFAHLIDGVKALGITAQRAIQNKSI